jgi:hypothetical protein
VKSSPGRGKGSAEGIEGIEGTEGVEGTEGGEGTRKVGRTMSVQDHVRGFGVAVAIAAQITALAAAQRFTLQVGPPVAGGGQPAKSSLLVVRPRDCVDPANAQIFATAEGLVDGVRRSVPLQLTPLTTPGVHAVAKGWPNAGVWLVHLVGTCAGQSAGIIVSFVGPPEYRREAVKHLPGPATPAQIDGALKSLTSGSQR